ncbi:trypsin-like peptidase domain-containing protein [Candidatus Thioglobus sp.]|nr:trypsin-like peptidase domain-containing protein [Candidatus Thioglobus sp.]
MSTLSSPRSIEYVESNFSPVNAHANSIVDNEKQHSRLKRFSADRALIKNIAIIALVVGILAILLAYAYSRANAPIIEIVEKPVYIDKPVYTIIKVPDPELSQVIEVPVYIEKLVKVPIQVGAVTDEFSFFHKELVSIDGIYSVTVGASYESVNSPYPEEQWCYADGKKSKSTNTNNRINLANKTGTSSAVSKSFTSKDAKEFGASIASLKQAVKNCIWYPDRPPIEDIASISPEIIDPKAPGAKIPPSSGGKSGTGFYINENGYLLTNNHVVDSCSSVWIDDGNSKIQASIIKVNAKLDIAVLRINKKTSAYAIFGQVRTGEDVMTLGFPLGDILGEEIKATKGVVSALVGYQGDKDYLQFTAPIQPGNSGGPLLNEGGFVVGINTSNLVGEDLQNINFAIKGTSALNFLGQYGIEFEHKDYVDAISSADIVEQSKEFTVRILCNN